MALFLLFLFWRYCPHTLEDFKSVPSAFYFLSHPSCNSTDISVPSITSSGKRFSSFSVFHCFSPKKCSDHRWVIHSSHGQHTRNSSICTFQTPLYANLPTLAVLVIHLTSSIKMVFFLNDWMGDKLRLCKKATKKCWVWVSVKSLRHPDCFIFSAEQLDFRWSKNPTFFLP